ncbi:hypothetical protein B0E43_19575 [Algoriphagus sp. A40]|nr:hypothetical protein B0E43_19575 [Algoriphagus sp. A40]
MNKKTFFKNQVSDSGSTFVNFQKIQESFVNLLIQYSDLEHLDGGKIQEKMVNVWHSGSQYY